MVLQRGFVLPRGGEYANSKLLRQISGFPQSLFLEGANSALFLIIKDG